MSKKDFTQTEKAYVTEDILSPVLIQVKRL